MSTLIRKSAGERLFTGFSYVFMAMASLSIVFPLMYIFQLTFSTVPDTTFRLLPVGFTLEHYAYIFNNDMIQRPFVNSVFVTAVSMVFSMVVTVLFAYPLSRRELFGRKYLNFLVIVPMVFSIGYIPKFLLVSQLGMIDTYSALIIPSAISTFNTIILRNFFQNIPDSLIESARLDGCSEMGTLIKIVLPLSMAAIATISLFYMVDVWNNYFRTILYINDRKKHTLQVILRALIMESELDASASSALDSLVYIKNIQYSTIVIAIIPVMMAYPFLQKYFVKGIMLGSVKG